MLIAHQRCHAAEEHLTAVKLIRSGGQHGLANVLHHVRAVEQEAVEFVGDGAVVPDHQVADGEKAGELVVFDGFGD
jgi:hypothetical protein